MHRCLAAALALAWARCAVATTGLTPFKDPRTCKGYEKQFKDCEGLPKCYECQPVDCDFAEWGEWFEAGGCTGVCFRQRGIAVSNNECGTPCSGLKQETKECLRPECYKEAEDCVLSDWGAWSTCGADFTAQKVRERSMIREPKFGGKECNGPTRETAPCGENPAVDCALTEWGQWTECSVSCGGGWHASMRRVHEAARLGGKPCEGVTRRTKPCNEQKCGETKDCLLGQWSDWSGCGLLGGVQKYRTRRVEQPSSYGGQACAEAVRETQGCPVAHADARPCEMSLWSSWAECSRSCDGGQTYRKRHIDHGPENGGQCVVESLHETKPCGSEPCSPPGANDCALAEWSEWTTCSAKCGTGISERNRKVLQPAKLGGKGCNSGLKETRGCVADKETCGATDCVWGVWEQWSACTCTCGGGTMRRERMIKVAPSNGGELCSPEDKSEIAVCNAQSCEMCVDGAWAQWEEWSSCSASCDKGFRSRHRDVAQHPNDCGQPVIGLEDEFEVCEATQPCVADTDCSLSEWTGWSACSSKCFGVAERQRHVIQYATGRGKTCHAAATKEVAQCNPGIGESSPVECGKPSPEPCMLGQWSEWGKCSAECNGGQKIRMRHILTPAKNEGEPCAGKLSETVPCGTQQCPNDCQDCLWDEWAEWGLCSKCGNQRYRHRNVRTMPNHCGKPCNMSAAKEVSSCHSTCEEVTFCAWSVWSSFSPCSAQCGPATRLRQRAMVTFAEAPESYIFQGPVSAACSGAQMEISACEHKPCGGEQDTVDCAFGAWAEWSAPTCTQLCERHRVIERMSQHGGALCEGQLVETKRCERDCTHAEDCKLSDWNEWGHCSSHEAQRYRSRSLAQEASNGGKECVGNLEETASCSEAPADIRSCQFSRWSEWGTCSMSCGGGLQTRERAVQDPAENGGAMCEGKLQELQMCNEFSCATTTAECVMGEWEAWTGCTNAHDGTKSRERKVLREPLNGGKACNGTLKELSSCNTGGTKCEVSEWTVWDECDKSCGGGQRFRHRQVTQNPEAGGEQCKESLMEIEGCNAEPCNRQDCAVSDWQAWGACTANCGTGQQARSRAVTQLPSDGGMGCNLGLNETRECRDAQGNPLAACPTVDCVWGLWSDWSSCSSNCEGGMRTRDRHIIQAPQKGGKSCTAWNKEETEPCNTQACQAKACIDGQWDEWEEWEPCDKTCDGGLTWRARKILAEANECGKPAVGDSRIYASCNAGVPCVKDVDCELSDWGLWSDCSKTCDGIMRRSRRIVATASGKGTACVGDLKQTAPCSPAMGEAAPTACMGAARMDCQLSEWQAWESCSVSCGGGQQSRSRELAKEAEGGGHCPQQALMQTQSCGNEACPDECMPVDCEWNEWSEWSACDKCGGEKRRFRHVAKVAHCGGTACDAGNSEEVTECTRKCHEQSYCAFGNWGTWSMCSATCGTGQHTRERHLQVTAEAEMRMLNDAAAQDSGLQAKYEQLRTETEALQRWHVQTLAVSFAAGLLSLMVGLAAVRAASRTRTGLSNQRDVEVTLE
uniref:Spondin-like TSP1 domain-containing protein n=1 Tax=Alexandrium catenella TaxID=2925 RepID=A0A7S1LSJ6_ALECA|mmetsp:Transcript_11882/g.32495  ORF Transcript_11882/g.32495 Transcript_11882/m.32495 type:complete len:1523 (+) Transcript_11882:58-4626(+)